MHIAIMKPSVGILFGQISLKCKLNDKKCKEWSGISTTRSRGYKKIFMFNSWESSAHAPGDADDHASPEVIKTSCSTQLSMKFFLLINVKMPTMVGILTFMSGKLAF